MPVSLKTFKLTDMISGKNIFERFFRMLTFVKTADSVEKCQNVPKYLGAICNLKY